MNEPRKTYSTNPFIQKRQEEADIRKAERSGRTDAQQLARLDAAFGPGIGAKKERAKLQARMATAASK